MRYGKLKRYLKKWEDAGLISAEQSQQIAQYMKVESHRQFLKLIRVLFILGAFWLLIGLIASLRLINPEILAAIARFFGRLAEPFIALAKLISPERYDTLLIGVACLLGWGLFHRFAMHLRQRSDVALTHLGALQQKRLRLGTSTLTMGYILAAIAWQCFNYVASPSNPHPYGEKPVVVVPWFSFIGLSFFLTIAYWMKDQIALLFGIGFMAHAVGMFTAYTFATYWIGVQQPAIQLLLGGLLIFVGLWHIEKVRGREDHVDFLFGRTYQGTGLLFGYLSLWIMSIWGVTYSAENYGVSTRAAELWAANLLFIGAALGGLFYGAAKEDRMFFNFGLTFLIIESYTVFFSYIWETLGAALGSLLLGALLIGTGYLLRHLWLRGRIFGKVPVS